MLNEDTIRQNKVCLLEGKAEGVAELLYSLSLNERKTISKAELETVATKYQQEYEKAWNEWADYAHIGGSRYDETGRGRKRGTVVNLPACENEQDLVANNID